MIILTPCDSHSARFSSISKILVAAKYSTGRSPCAAAAFIAAATGDGHCLPVANHDSASAIQKSGSLCVAIAYLSVITISPSVVIDSEFDFKNSIKSLFSAIGFGDGAGGISGFDSTGLSNVTSLNTGAPGIDDDFGAEKSKSLGIGNASFASDSGGMAAAPMCMFSVSGVGIAGAVGAGITSAAAGPSGVIGMLDAGDCCV